MAVADLKQCALDPYRQIQRRARHQFLVIQISPVYPWRCAVPPARGRRWRYPHTAKERAQWNIDTVIEMPDHLFPVKRDDPHSAAEDLIRQEPSLSDTVISIWDRKVDRVEPDLQNIPRVSPIDIDGSRQYMPARPPVLDRLHIPQLL